LLFDPVTRNNAFRAFQHGELCRIADVGGLLLIAFRQTQDAFDLVTDITEAACLPAVAVDGEIVAAQCLLHEVRDYAAIV